MTTQLAHSPLEGVDLTLSYDGRAISRGLDVRVPAGEFTVIVGPNACGKSTLLKALARILRPEAGSVLLDGADIRSRPAKDVARRLGLLPQSATAPEAITVRDLVGRGRYPHQRFLRQWSTHDGDAVEDAMQLMGVTHLATRPIDELSGGQRQRVWLAMVVAQETPVLLLDEPTTYLDIVHQLDVLDLCADMQERGRTLVAVLHDLNHACRYATHLICMRDGAVIAQGSPEELVTADLVHEVFGLRCDVIGDPQTGTPLVVPSPRRARRAARARVEAATHT